MKTTRVWPIPRASMFPVYDDQIFTISAYRPSTEESNNPIRIRLCSVDLAIQNLVSHDELSVEIVVGIGNGELIGDAQLLASNQIPRLDPNHEILPPHQIRYGIRSGGAGFLGSWYWDFASRINYDISWERQVLGVCRNRRPLRFRWRAEERPCMHIWKAQSCPCIWGRPHFSPASTMLQAVIMGMVTFEADQ